MRIKKRINYWKLRPNKEREPYTCIHIKDYLALYNQYIYTERNIYIMIQKGLLYRELNLDHPFHDITNGLMYKQKDNKSGRTFSVIDYEGKRICDKDDEDEIEFEGENLDDTDRLQPDSDQ